MWFAMERLQGEYALSERLLDAINLDASPAGPHFRGGRKWSIRGRALSTHLAVQMAPSG